MENYKLLENWLTQCLVDNPDIITQSEKPVQVYDRLFDLWVPDCQKMLKELITDARKIKG
jgi:hypothetical protein